jgi:hypothetical protein
MSPRSSPTVSMPTDDLAKLLEPFDVDSHAIVVLIDDRDAAKVAAVWPHLPTTWKAPRKAMPDDERQRWSWLWSGCSFSMQQLAEMAGMDAPITERKLRMLQGARLIRPDGTTAKIALDAAKKLAANALKVKR